MSINISIIKETRPGEKRVAMVPSVASRLSRLGSTLSMETSAGVAATFADKAYTDTRFESDATALVSGADIVLAVQPPPVAVVKAMKPGAVLISFIYGASNPALVAALKERKVTALAMELIPRISRAQAMDALSSQAAFSGYYAPLL